jgi:predicted transcriptional regulator
MAYRKTYKTDIDAEVLRHLSPEEWESIDSLQRWTGLHTGTLRNSLRRHCEAGLADRRWDGNERFGRYVYARRMFDLGSRHSVTCMPKS